MPESGSITGYIDVAQLVLYGFWIFFTGLIIYLRKEDKREGYPLENERSGLVKVHGWPGMPEAKTFKLSHGGTYSAPGRPVDTREIKLKPAHPHLGAPFVPTGDPMADGVGPASYAERSDTPDMTYFGEIKIVPLRVATDHYLETRDPDPRGMDVVGADGVVGGVVRDAWVDRSEVVIRYYEVEVAGGRRVLLPSNYTKVDGRTRKVNVKSVFGKHFATAPGLKNPEQVTLREEDRIVAYYAGGYLYASPDRAEPFL